MAHHFRKNPESMDLTSELDMRTTEEIEQEADKEAVEKPETVLEIGEGEDTPELHHGGYDPDKDPEYLRLKKESESTKEDKAQPLSEPRVITAYDKDAMQRGGPRIERITGSVFMKGSGMKNAKDDKTPQRRKNRKKRDMAV